MGGELISSEKDNEMKHTLTALTLALGITLVPAASMASGLSSLTLNLTYPESTPAPATATRGITVPAPAPTTLDGFGNER